MTKLKKSLIGMILVFVFIFLSLGYSLDAYAYSAASNKLNTNYTLSGNGAEDIYAVAKAQLNKKYPEFSRFNYRAWCADFVSACAAAANVSDAVPGAAAVTNLRANIVKAGGTEYSKAQIQKGNYTPVRGDIIIFKSNGDSHVGIVDKAENGKIYYIDGNNTTYGNGNNACVHYSNRAYSYAGFTCVVKPKYKNNLAPSGNNPFGQIEGIESTYEGVKISGWAVDMDAPNDPVEVHIYVGGAADSGQAKNVFKLTANLPRGDVSQQYPGAGENHGYYGVLDIEGPEVLYVYFYNIGSGENTLIGTPTVQGKNHSPLGHIDGIESTYEGVKISGWAFDIDIPNDPIEVHIYVGGAADSGQAKNVFKLTADGSRADVPKKYLGVGENHGFEGLLDITETETLYVYLYNVGLGENILIGTPTVMGKSHNPVGSIDNISSTCEGVKISGWAIDGDALTESVDIHIYVGGAADSGQAKNVYQIKADIFRQDLEDKFVIAGGKHGYSAILDIPGTEDIYIYLINKGSGANTLLGISTVSSKEHTLASIPINQKDATCIEEGYSGDKYCEVCKKIVEKGKTIPKMDHQWDSGEITKAATCTELGTKTYTCTNCNTTRTEKISATGNHQNTELRDAKTATCIQEGYTGDTYCKDCGTKLSSGKTIAKTDHIWDSGKITKTATCKESGTKTYTCTSCNTTKTEEIPATGNHQNTEFRNVKEATCAQEGYTGDTYCKDCGEKLSSGETIAKTDHIWDSGRITKPATDTESGIKTYTCINCNTTRTEEIPATGEHPNTEIRGAKSATCLEEGYTGDTYCKDCGIKLSSGTVIPKTGHIWDEGTVTKAATCTEKGIRTYTCSVCESTKIEEIPFAGHGTKITKFAKEATYTQEGYSGDIYCQDCGELLEEGRVLAKLEQPDRKAMPGEMIDDKVTNGVYRVLADGCSVEFVKQIVQKKVVKIPDTVSINGTFYTVTGISASALKNNQLLRTAVVGSNVRKIGKQAFYNCKNLRTITIRTSMLTKKNVGAKAFKGTYKKIKVKVPAKQFKTYKKFFKSKGMGAKAIYKK